VVSIQPYTMPTPQDERQDQIVAGNLSGNVPSGPGYMTWLASKGFTQAQFTASNFASMSPTAASTTAPSRRNHFGLYLSGAVPGTARIVYNRLVGTPHGGSTIQAGRARHPQHPHRPGLGTTTAGSPFADGAGYHYGLGVCPFTKAAPPSSSIPAASPPQLRQPPVHGLQQRRPHQHQ